MMNDTKPKIMNFKPARRIGSRVIITCFAESGAGKTRSMLRLARGLAGESGRIVMIDTENGRGLMHAEHIPGGFVHSELTKPHTPERYIQALDEAEDFGADVIVLDSGSAEWEGFGGVLDIADEQRTKSGSEMKGLLKWSVPKAKHKRYYQRLIDCKCHLIICLRAKEKMVTKGDTIASDGLVPIQDKRFVFEATIQLHFPTGGQRGVPSLQWPHFKCSDDLEGAFPPGEQITENTGRMIAEWVAGGTPVDRQYEELKRRAEDAAAKGTEVYREWWKVGGREVRDRLADIHENNKSIAAEADKRLSDTVTGIAADAAGASDAGSLEMRLAAATTMAAIDTIENDWRAPMSEMSHEGWLECQAKIDARKVEVQQ